MGMKKSNAFMMMSLAMMMSEGINYPHITNDEYLGRTPTKEEIEEREKRIKAEKEADRIKRLKSKGIKEFFYGGKVIYARNKKNADRKAQNKGYL